MTAARRILLVGWSAADWRLLNPLLDAGSLPHLARLLERGARGNLRTLQPQFDPLLWTSIATGRRADTHGVLHTLLPDPDGGIRPLSRLDRKCQALWNIADRRECRSIVVNWPVTYPAEPVEGACVSDLFFRLASPANGLEPPPPGATHPAKLADNIEDLRFSPSELSRAEMAYFVPDIEAAEAESDPMLTRLAVAVAETISTHAVAMELTQGDAWDLAMVRYDILETLGAEFMACYPPQLSYVPDRMFERYQATIPAVCRYLDLMLGVLVEQVGPDCLVVLISERGIHSDKLRPQDPLTAFQQVGNAPWFREQGVVVLSGPGVTAGAFIQGAGLLDIVPTILRYMDIPVGGDMPGRVLREAFAELPREQHVATYEQCGHEQSSQKQFSRQNPAQKRPPLQEVQRQALLNHWQEVGLLDGGILDTQTIDSTDAAASARRQFDFNRAMVAVEARHSRRALELLEFLHQEFPDDDRYALHLARARRNTGDLDGARELLEMVVDHPDKRPYEQMQLAQLQLAAGEHDKALLCLFRAEQAEGDRPDVHSQIGQVYLAMQRWDEAERAFSKALERDSEHAESQRGMAATRLGQKRYKECIDAALRAVELDRNRPQAHYFLGAALLADGQHAIAAQVFETCLKLEPRHADAHRGLADACQLLGEESTAAEHRKIAQQLKSAALLQRQLSDYRRQ